MGPDLSSDERLQNHARYTLYACPCDDAALKSQVEKLINKDKLTEADKKVMWTFIEATKKSKPKSMKDMKLEILRMVGGDVSNAYSNTMSASEMESVYKWFCENYKKD